jgi:hypothetical protein
MHQTSHTLHSLSYSYNYAWILLENKGFSGDKKELIELLTAEEQGQIQEF